jgi:L-ascorbate metabolism protein UlaG (beta-lactamase superfamily)
MRRSIGLKWHRYANWAKRRPTALRVADRLGRGRGRFRVLDRLNPPAASELKPDLSNWTDHELAATWIGHATVLLRIGSMTILTDPVFSNRVGVGLGVCTGGPCRRVAPALSIRELPKIDLLLISHAHYDHLDRPTLARLPKRTPIVTAHRTRDLLADLGFGQITELRWGESHVAGSLRITAHEVAHWGARTFYDHHRGYNAYEIEHTGTLGGRILFGGDTAYHEGFRDIAPVDLAVLGIGGYAPAIHCHANPEQAWAMANHLQAERMLPMHHGTFRLSLEPPGEALQRLLTVAGQGADRVVAREPGGLWVRGRDDSSAHRVVAS